MNIEFEKYKRVFTFGCSFTNYVYPTWANILSKSLPDAEFYNLGLSGTSNPFIAHRMVEANKKFKFCETDLVVTMWTTTARETHYVRGNWINPGNIFSQDVYSKEFVEKFADSNGYLIRDLATIELATVYINTLSCTYIGLLSTPIDFLYVSDLNLGYDEKVANEILDTYKDLLSIFPKSLYELEMNFSWDPGSKYKSTMFSRISADYHPNPVRYYNYLNKLGFPLTDESLRYAKESNRMLKQITHRNEFPIIFPYCGDQPVEGIW
jgi:hypothetical protein